MRVRTESCKTDEENKAPTMKIILLECGKSRRDVCEECLHESENGISICTQPLALFNHLSGQKNAATSWTYCPNLHTWVTYNHLNNIFWKCAALSIFLII
ncbi:hypothetical protein L1049_027480 [Liquidambar formosana]|uniref:Uncharacterized protein n=1 Tax=Liquidambar formosana TaxID=63359 RepID=A0AAP0RIU2_LIQFO